jgi:hypothetical protein
LRPPSICFTAAMTFSSLCRLFFMSNSPFKTGEFWLRLAEFSGARQVQQNGLSSHGRLRFHVPTPQIARVPKT